MSSSQPSPDYTTYSPDALIARITDLETQLRTTASHLSNLRATASTSTSQNRSRSSKKSKPFDPTRFSTRLIALKFSYMGQHYNGFEHANGTVPPKPTIEEVLWKALRKARLISPELKEGADESMDVVWDAEERARVYMSAEEIGKSLSVGKKRLELNWEGCEYSKCGRTDRGVSAFGQVVGVRVRSNRPKAVDERSVEAEGDGSGARNGVEQQQTNDDSTISSTDPSSPLASAADVSSSPASQADARPHNPDFDTIADELAYLSILNAILPPSIRILAWCPHPPEGFDARFSCKERRYKYFFTNPAFIPTPGRLGMQFADGSPALVREGWLDIEAMRKAAKKLEGLHDYRNLCKLDPSKQMSSCERRISFADVAVWRGSGKELIVNEALNANATNSESLVRSVDGEGAEMTGPRVYCFSVHGSAFLWHQVRCMIAVLFLVGQGLEKPDIVDELLNIAKNPGKPTYEMADDGPLVLWDCVFDDPDDGGQGKLDWIYAGDAKMIPSLTTKNDGKFGLGGVVDTLWTQWRRAKLEEIVTSGLLDLALSQGDGSAFLRGGFRDAQTAPRSQKVFEGSSTARLVGTYTSVMKKKKMDTLEEQNEKYRDGRGSRKGQNGQPVG